MERFLFSHGVRFSASCPLKAAEVRKRVSRRRGVLEAAVALEAECCSVTQELRGLKKNPSRKSTVHPGLLQRQLGCRILSFYHSVREALVKDQRKRAALPIRWASGLASEPLIRIMASQRKKGPLRIGGETVCSLPLWQSA